MPDAAAALYLQAGWAFLEEGSPASAAQAFDALEPAWLDREDLPSYQLLGARVALIRNDPRTARQFLSRLPADVQRSPRGLETSSQVCAAAGDFVCAANQLITAAGTETAYNDRIWAYLEQASGYSAALERERQTNRTARDWWALYDQVLRAFARDELVAGVNAWRAAHRSHPAAVLPPTQLTDYLERRPAPRHIALLLPLSGPLQKAGESIRDGFISAMLIAGRTDQVEVTLFDAAAEPLPLIYERALSRNVELIVGPLQKELVADFNALGPEIPTLLLNYLDDNVMPAPGVIQLGLAIEDEARSIARRLVDDDRSNVLVFHNYQDWSMRARRTLARTSAMPLTFQSFTDVRTVTEAVGSAMHVAGSTERREQLDALFGEQLEFLPRARSDMDAVVALVDNVEANALVPALRFHFADHLPVYASSQVTRQSRTGQLNELNGFFVSELPWLIDDNPTYRELAGAFALDQNPFASLFILGADAFRVTERTSLTHRGHFNPLLGGSGVLSMNEYGRISRELAWGRIRNGQVVSASAAASRAGIPGGSR